MPQILIRILFLCLFLSGGMIKQSKSAQDAFMEPWTPVTGGITYREFYTNHPNHVYVARMDRNSETAILDTAIGNGDFSSGLQTVRNMASFYDQSIGYWGRNWGTRNQVAVAINGFFYDTETGIPWSGQVSSGWYVKRFDERQSGSSLVWTFDRNLFVADCVDHPSNRQKISFPTQNEFILFDAINSPDKDNSLVVYTSHYGRSFQAEEETVQVVVELERPLMIMPDPAVIKGVIVEVILEAKSILIPFDHIILSASGNKKEKLLQLARPGGEIEISQELKHYQPDCKTPNPIIWENVYAASGASFVFLKDGTVQALNEDLGAVIRSPRTAIAYNDQYVFFIVVDGRDRFRSLGMSMADLGVFSKMTLGADWGVAMDGGGSSTMVVKGKVVNQPLTSVEEVTLQGSSITTSNQIISYNRSENFQEPFWRPLNLSVWVSEQDQIQEIERAVANGWMMITSLPDQRSIKYQETDSIVITQPEGSPLTLGPGDNYSVIVDLAYGNTGVIHEHPLNGIFARNAFWWKVKFGNLEGWICESDITAR